MLIAHKCPGNPTGVHHERAYRIAPKHGRVEVTEIDTVHIFEVLMVVDLFICKHCGCVYTEATTE